jgi:hypothetical protein
MIEVGEEAYPVLQDIDHDGLLDLVIGNTGYYQNTGNNKAQIAFYKNIGSSSSPVFKLINKDWMHFSNLNLNGMIPSFADLDQDGDVDLICGTIDGKLNYFENLGTGNYALPILNYQNIDVGDMATPQFVDLDEDGLIDLVIGEKFGNINYYKNTGTSHSPSFTLVTANLGNVDVRENGNLTGYSAPHFCKLTPNSDWTLLVGNEEGHIQTYQNIKNNLNGTFNCTDFLFTQQDQGLRASVCSGSISGADTIEVMTGNFNGGVRLYKLDTIVINAIAIAIKPNLSWNLFPNPSANELNVAIPLTTYQGTITITDILGRLLYSRVLHNESTIVIPVAQLENGNYQLVLSIQGQQSVKKLTIIH